MPRVTAAPYAATPGRSTVPVHHGRFCRRSTGSCEPQTRDHADDRLACVAAAKLIGATRSTIRRLEVAGRFIRPSTLLAVTASSPPRLRASPVIDGRYCRGARSASRERAPRLAAVPDERTVRRRDERRPSDARWSCMSCRVACRRRRTTKITHRSCHSCGQPWRLNWTTRDRLHRSRQWSRCCSLLVKASSRCGEMISSS